MGELLSVLKSEPPKGAGPTEPDVGCSSPFRVGDMRVLPVSRSLAPRPIIQGEGYSRVITKDVPSANLTK